MRTGRHTVAVAALPLALLTQAGRHLATSEPSPMQIRVASMDSSQVATFRLETRGARVRVVSGEIQLSSDGVRATTPVVLVLENDPGRLTLTSETRADLDVDVMPASGARFPHLVGTGRDVTVERAKRDGTVRILTGWRLFR